VATRAAAMAAEARARGDRYTESTARAYILPLAWLAVDRAADAREEARQAIALWGEAGSWHHQHWAELRAQCCVDLYEGDGARAAQRLDETRRRLKESLVLRLRTPRLEHAHLEARGLLEAAWATKSPAGLLRRVAALADRLEGEHNRFAAAYACSLRAGIAARGGNEGDTRAAFRAAERTFEALTMPLHAAAARRRQGELAAGDVGRDLVASSDARLAELGAKAPERFARFLVPRAR
jgi:hypothetical protein